MSTSHGSPVRLLYAIIAVPVLLDLEFRSRAIYRDDWQAAEHINRKRFPAQAPMSTASRFLVLE